eukprot:scaffold9695_cov62-Phaeocystis_antarctica.AAC.2
MALAWVRLTTSALGGKHQTPVLLRRSDATQKDCSTPSLRRPGETNELARPYCELLPSQIWNHGAFSPSVTHPQLTLPPAWRSFRPISPPNPHTHTYSSEFRVYSSLHTANAHERMHVLDPRLGGWAARMYGWAAEELAGRRLPASPEQLEEEERDNAYDKAGFLSFMEFGGFDLGQAGY